MARLLSEKTGGGDVLRLRAVVVRRSSDDDLTKRAALLRRDSIHGSFKGTIRVDEERNAFIANGNEIKLIYADAPENVDYTAHGIDNAIVIDNTGKWRDEAGLARHLQAKGDWDAGTWGLPINQIDMQATYLAFGPVTLLGARLFGVPIGLRESRAAMHLWRYIGWLSGVREEWLAVTERDGLRKLYHTFLTHDLPDEKIGLMGRALRDQPLTQHLPELAGHPRLAALKRRYLYERHISNSSLILLPTQRRQLGIPFHALPWYPLATAPFRFAWLGLLKLRGERAQEAWRRHSREKQRQLLQSYFADREADLIRPAAEHPASIDYRCPPATTITTTTPQTRTP